MNKPKIPILTQYSTFKECCTNCKHFESHREIEGKSTGVCEWMGDTEYDNPDHVYCFDFEIFEEEE